MDCTVGKDVQHLDKKCTLTYTDLANWILHNEDTTPFLICLLSSFYTIFSNSHDTTPFVWKCIAVYWTLTYMPSRNWILHNEDRFRTHLNKNHTNASWQINSSLLVPYWCTLNPTLISTATTILIIVLYHLFQQLCIESITLVHCYNLT